MNFPVASEEMTQRLVAESRSARIEICCYPYEGMGSRVRGLGGSRTLLVPSGTNGGRLRERAGAAAPDAMVDSVADVLRGSVHLKELLEHCATHLGHRQVATRVEIVGTPPDVVTDRDDLWLSLGLTISPVFRCARWHFSKFELTLPYLCQMNRCEEDRQ